MHHRKGGTEWLDINNSGKFRRYDPNNIPPGTHSKITFSGGYHSPDDMLNLAGTNSLVLGRNGSSYYYNIGPYPTTLRAHDPFVRFFLFPWSW